MRFRPVGGFDLATGALIFGGACLVAASIVAATVLLAPPAASPETDMPAATTPALTEGQVATTLSVDSSSGAGGMAQPGDRIDVLGYFSHQVTGGDAVTRVLLQDVQVLATQRSGTNTLLTLALPQTSAVLLQEAQAIGARPFVALRSSTRAGGLPASFSDTDLAGRLTAGH
jgi:Flp pilus assembly protein CpaB